MAPNSRRLSEFVPALPSLFESPPVWELKPEPSVGTLVAKSTKLIAATFLMSSLVITVTGVGALKAVAGHERARHHDFRNLLGVAGLLGSGRSLFRFLRGLRRPRRCGQQRCDGKHYLVLESRP